MSSSPCRCSHLPETEWPVTGGAVVAHNLTTVYLSLSISAVRVDGPRSSCCRWSLSWSWDLLPKVTSSRVQSVDDPSHPASAAVDREIYTIQHPAQGQLPESGRAIRACGLVGTSVLYNILCYITASCCQENCLPGNKLFQAT